MKSIERFFNAIPGTPLGLYAKPLREAVDERFTNRIHGDVRAILAAHRELDVNAGNEPWPQGEMIGRLLSKTARRPTPQPPLEMLR